ncbi:hypothetical protein KIW84_025576 [Lathyrus oleraceus]|uniref:Uncharacterized protein n=1 Tax=Pisum sativum TaxID=3888 RepID=A0A9D4YKU9_PEA|nr:hypothetical protein KIW84_025576 [Pisum sativum]
MDVVREEQATFREEMDSVKSKIEQIFEAIQALARREEEARVAAAARNDALVQGVALQNHVPPPAHTSGVADGVVVQGHPIVNQVVMPHTDEELQDEFEMQNYNGATPVVILTRSAAQYPTMPYRPIAPIPIPAPVPHYQVPVPQYQAPQPQFQAPPPQHQQRNQQNNQPRPVQQQRPNQQYNNVNTTHIPMSYTQLLPYLIQNGTVMPRALPPMPKPHKPWYDENARYQKIHQGKVPSIQEVFSKAGFRSDDQVNALEDEDLDLSKMVFCGPPEAALTNWKATDVPDIVSCSK